MEKNKFRCLLLLLTALGIYSLENHYVTKLIGSFNFVYVVKPFLWCGLALAIYLMPVLRYKSKLRTRNFINSWSFIFAVVYFSVQFLAGLVDGFGKSPYEHSPVGIVINLVTVGAVLIGREFFRSYFVHSMTKAENYKVLLTISLLFTILAFPMKKYMDLQGYESIVKFTAQFFLPEFSENVMATYLVFLGGPIASLTFLGTLEAVNLLSPILPDLQWITAALVGILTPVFLFTVMQSMFEVESKQRRNSDVQKEGHLSWIMTTLAAVGIVWFAVGVFPVYPSVIATGSMEPMIHPGDVILVRKITDIKEVQVGDVIQFQRDDIRISHRIISIITKDGVPSFQTRGDNNSAIDSELVSPEQLRGEVINVVPHIGWPTLLMKSDKDIPLDEIEF
ncbi:MAG: peptidase signal peptidase [Bacillota bacterium]|jgi:signal peptidase|nr:peptidase signal peptidase [Bacillota bacterium]